MLFLNIKETSLIFEFLKAQEHFKILSYVENILKVQRKHWGFSPEQNIGPSLYSAMFWT